MNQTPHYGHPPIAMQRVRDQDAVKSLGDFAWRVEENGDRYLLFTVPRPLPDNPKGWLFNCLPVKQGPNESGRHWGWDGNEEQPTLTPSIHALGHWHGWIREGKLIEA